MIRLVNSKNFGAVENWSNDDAVSLAYKSRQNCLDKVKVLLLIYFWTCALIIALMKMGYALT